jgi:hypothetical protein
MEMTELNARFADFERPTRHLYLYIVRTRHALLARLLVDVFREDEWCREGESNPHSPFGPADFKSAASANFAIPASERNARSHSP